jgi:hypothetical protein
VSGVHGLRDTKFSGPSQLPRIVFGKNLYNAPTLNLRRAHLIVLAVLVAAFVALYPSLGVAEMCNPGECPYATHSSQTTSAGFSALCLGAVLSAIPAVLTFVASRGRRSIVADPLPTQLHSSPDPPPPRFL